MNPERIWLMLLVQVQNKDFHTIPALWKLNASPDLADGSGRSASLHAAAEFNHQQAGALLQNIEFPCTSAHVVMMSCAAQGGTGAVDLNSRSYLSSSSCFVHNQVWDSTCLGRLLVVGRVVRWVEFKYSECESTNSRVSRRYCSGFRCIEELLHHTLNTSTTNKATLCS